MGKSLSVKSVTFSSSSLALVYDLEFPWNAEGWGNHAKQMSISPLCIKLRRGDTACLHQD